MISSIPRSFRLTGDTQWLIPVALGFALIGGVTVAFGAYILLPIFILPFIFSFALILKIDEQYSVKLFFVLGTLLLISNLIWPRYAYIRLSGLPGITPTRIILAITLFSVLIYTLRSKVFRNNLLSALSEGRSIFLFVLLFTAFRFFSVIFAANPFDSLFGFLNELVFFFLMFIIYVAAFRTSVEIYRIVPYLMCLTFFICLISIVELSLQKNIFLGVLPVTDAYAQEALLGKVRDSGYRIQSTFDHPLSYAQYLATVLPILIASVIFFKSYIFRVFAAVTVSLVLGSVWFTGSRSGIALSIAAILIMVTLVFSINLKRRKVRLSTVVILLFCLAIAVLVGMSFIDHLQLLISGRSAAEASSTSARFIMLNRALPLVFDSLIFGYGINQAATLIGFVGSKNLLTVDSLIISIAVDSGIIALTAYLLSIFSAIIFALKTALHRTNNDGILQIAFATSLLVFLMTTFTLSLSGNMFLLAFLLASVVALRRKPLPA